MNDIQHRDDIVDEPDPLAALPSETHADAATTFAKALEMITVMKRHREVLGECLHCGSPDFCEREAQVFGLMTAVGDHVQRVEGAAAALGALASGRPLGKALDALPGDVGRLAITD